MTTLLAVTLALAAHTTALKVPITERAVSPIPFKVQSTNNKPMLKSFVASSSGSELTLGNVNNLVYVAPVKLGDGTFNLQLDTNAADMWCNLGAAPAAFNAKKLGLPALNITSLDGTVSVSGDVVVAKVSFGPFSVAEQAFLSTTSAKSPALVQGADGVLGFGFNSASVIQKAASSLPAKTGQTFLTWAFEQHPSGRDYIAFSLGRADDPSATARDGAFYIGEVDDEHKSVLDAPALPVFKNPAPDAVQRWVISVDSLKVAGVNVEGTTAVKNATGKQLALIDTGASQTLLPKEAVTAIYSNIKGSKYDAVLDVWFSPCLSQTTVTFNLGGIEYPINPLDLTTPMQSALKNDTIVTYCVNKFRTNKYTTEYDIVLGDPVLRNLFSVFDFGDIDSTGKVTGEPFVKLLSVTDAVKAAASFEASRKSELQLYPELGDLADVGNTAARQVANFAATTSTSKHKSTHKSTGTGTFRIQHNVAAVANAEDTSSTNISSQVQQLLDFSPILLALLAANIVLGLGLCALGAYIVRSNRAKRNRREPLRRDTANTASSYEPVKVGDEPLSPMGYRDSGAYRDSVAIDDATGKPRPSTTYRDSGIGWADVDINKQRPGPAGPPVQTAGDMGVRDNSPFLDPNSPRNVAFPGAQNLSSPSRDSLAAPDERRRAPSAGSVYSQGQGTQSRDDLAPPNPSFAGGRRPSRDMPSPAADSPNAQMPLAGQQYGGASPGVGLRPQRQPSTGPPPPDSRALSLYESTETSEHQLAAQQRRYSHVPPAFGAGPSVPPPFQPQSSGLSSGSPTLPARSSARQIPGPQAGSPSHQRRPSH
ncbi:acid protease [Auriculariales sp. MPI-PUGE-AT-0066]|nr:acid protease [Auriculariales sp. MPI-PUGE-AT-0066]